MIRSLSLNNFMSYASAEIPFSSGINFICGPNGSGKSSILIAISLALGISRSERSQKLSDLIRWGADRASIRLVLDNRAKNGTRPFPDYETDDLVVERLLNRTGAYPIKIDGVPSTKEELTALIQSHGINPDNMLVIMQQDMVEAFSLLSPVQKLEMLEEVIEFQSYRRDLLQAKDDLDALLEEEKQTRRILEGSSRRVTEWERLYEKYQRKRKLEDDLEDLRSEALWAKVVEGEKTVQLLESRRGEREQEHEHLQNRLEELEVRIKDKLARVEEGWANLEAEKNGLITSVREHAARASKAEMLRALLRDQETKRGLVEDSLNKDRANAELAIRRLDELRTSGGDQEQALRDQASRLREALRGIHRENEIVTLQVEMASKAARCEELEKDMGLLQDRIQNPYGQAVAKAGEGVRSLQGLAGEVYGPIYSCIQSDDFSFDVLESMLGDRFMRAFVATNEADKARIWSYLNECDLDSEIYVVAESALVLLEERPLPVEEGVIDWVVNRLRAPKPVQALLHRIVGGVLLVRSGEPVEDLSRRLMAPVMNREGESAGLLDGLVPRLAGRASESRRSLRLELERLTEAHSKLENEISSISERLAAAGQERDAAFGSALDNLLQLHSRLELMRSGKLPDDLVLRREEERIRVRFEALAELKERDLAEHERSIKQLQADLASTEKDATRLEGELARAEMRYQRSREKLERQLQGYYELVGKRLVLTDQLRSANAGLRDLDYRISQKKEEVQRLIREAEDLSPRVPSPRELLELERQINTIGGSLKELSDVPDDIEGVYRMYLSDFENLRKNLQSIMEKKEEMQAELRRGLDRWSSIMDRYLAEINRDFDQILASIGARGRVTLTEGDVRSVGLDVQVGFSGKEMTSISTLSQSGGEKSLSTMSFLLALQNQVRSPFRAVDEYDVHLDPMNRDKVTRLLKSAVGRDRNKQYLAITPSQISKEDLEGAENVIVVQSIEGRSRVGSLVLEAQ